MHRFAKIILAVIAGLAGLVLLVLVGINLYLQSAEVQQRIRLATERAIGMPVTVNRTLYTPWSGLTLTGLSLPDPSIPDAHLVRAPSFSVKFEFLPLLARRFVISEVNLDAPHLALRQTADRRWILVPPRPTAPAAPAPPKEDRPAAPKVTVPQYSVEIRAFHIVNGSAEIIDRKGVVLARVDELQLDGRVEPGGRIEGDLWVEKIALVDQFFPNRLRAHFVRSGDKFVVSDLKAALAGGRIRAEAQINTPRGGKPAFEIRGGLEEVSLPTLIAEATGDSAGAAGTLRGDFNLRGNPLDSSTLAGRGEFALSEGRIRPLDFIQQIGAILRIDELQLLELRQATVRAEVRDERVVLEDFTLRTENLAITGKGPIRFNGKLKLDCRLLLNDRLQRQLDAILGGSLEPSEDAN